MAKIQALLRRSLSFKSQPQNQEPLRKDKFRPQNFVDIMTVEIFRFGSITRIRCLSWHGKSQSNLWTIITIYPFFSTEPDKNSIPIDLLRFWEHTICWTKGEIRYCQSFRSSSSQSKVNQSLSSRFEHQRPWNHSHYAEGHSKVGSFRRNDRRSPGPLLSTNLARF